MTCFYYSSACWFDRDTDWFTICGTISDMFLLFQCVLVWQRYRLIYNMWDYKWHVFIIPVRDGLTEIQIDLQYVGLYVTCFYYSSAWWFDRDTDWFTICGTISDMFLLFQCVMVWQRYRLIYNMWDYKWHVFIIPVRVGLTEIQIDLQYVAL